VSGRLTLVATPIGNLGDLAPRAVATLEEADVVCCEDTRRTRALMTAAGVGARGRLLSLHAHNEAARTQTVLGHLVAGRHVALVTDAGTPAVSDPGWRVVTAAAAAGHPVTCVPGPSSVLAALVVSGLPTDRFCVEGFLPRRGAERRRLLEHLAHEERTTVILESPQRLGATLGDLEQACGAERPVAVARELTKLHEEVWRGTLADARRHFDGEVRGEVVVVLGGAPPPLPPDDEVIRAALRRALEGGATQRAAAHAVAHALGVPRRRAYELAIALRDERPD
jgi:16S rRNA (cytidine1402-2'-O)-methyltransferase